MKGVDVHPNAQAQLVESLDLKDIKEVQDLILRNDGVLIEAEFKSTSGLILANGTGSTSVDKLKVIKVGSTVKAVKPGDYVLDITGARSAMYLHKGDKRYVLTNEYAINLATTEENII